MCCGSVIHRSPVIARALPVAILPSFTLLPPRVPFPMRVLFLIPVNEVVFVILSGAQRSRRIWQEQKYYHPDYQILRYAQNDNVGVRNGINHHSEEGQVGGYGAR